MTAVLEDRDAYLADFSRLEKEKASAWLHSVRQAAMDRFAEIGFPTTDEEEWRFTSLAPLTRVPFRRADIRGTEFDAHEIQAKLADGGLPRIVFINGQHVPELSRPPAGLAFAGSLVDALAREPNVVEQYLARHARHEEHPFIALNTAFLRDGAYLRIADGAEVASPVHLVYLSTAPGRPTVSHPRTLIVAGRNSRLTVIESYLGRDGETYFTNPVTEVVVADGAAVDHYKLQQDGDSAFHVATLQIQQSRNSSFSTHFVSLGGFLVRNEVNAVLDGEGATATLNGLYTGSNNQHVDNRTLIDHAQPHCTSHELYKGILRDRARGVFNGKIHVHQDAQKTDAKQTNQTLLLSEDATINTKPQLEIYADDVKCTHGATVGQLSEEPLFYLRSRGIGEAEARALLTYAFAEDVVSRIRVPAVRARIEDVLLAGQGLPAEVRGGDL